MSDKKKKEIALVVAGSGEIRDFTITPGAKVSEMLAATGLTGYMVSKGPDQPFLRPDDDLYAAVSDRDKLFASTKAEAGR